MTKGVPVVPSYRSRRREVRETLNTALASRHSYSGFLLGLAATMAIIGFVFAYLSARPDLFAY